MDCFEVGRLLLWGAVGGASEGRGVRHVTERLRGCVQVTRFSHFPHLTPLSGSSPAGRGSSHLLLSHRGSERHRGGAGCTGAL